GGVPCLEAVCDTMARPSIPARRPSAGARPGRCGLCLAADTHRPLYNGSYPEDRGHTAREKAETHSESFDRLTLQTPCSSPWLVLLPPVPRHPLKAPRPPRHPPAYSAPAVVAGGCFH